jgi:hypothetical protein
MNAAVLDGRMFQQNFEMDKIRGFQKKSFGGGDFQTKTARNCFLQLLQIP